MSSPIVVGVDGSERAQDAVTLGRRLSITLEQPVLVVSCYGHELARVSRMVTAYEQTLREEAERNLDRALAMLDGTVQLEARAIFTPSPARGLIEAAEAAGACAVVVGSSHRGALARTMTGSVSERVVQNAPCAVAIAPLGYQDPPMQTVGVAYDGSVESQSALRAATAVAERTGAQVTLLNVLVPPNPANPLFAVTGHGYTEILEDLRGIHRAQLRQGLETLSGRAASAETMLLEGDVVDELLGQTEFLDLLALGSRAYGPLRRVAAGTVSIGVLRGAACPVLILPRGIDSPFDGTEVDRATSDGRDEASTTAAQR